MHISWAWLAASLSKSNSCFASKPPAISAIRATCVEYRFVEFRYSNNRCNFSSQQRSSMLLRPLRQIWRAVARFISHWTTGGANFIGYIVNSVSVVKTCQVPSLHYPEGRSAWEVSGDFGQG